MRIKGQVGVERSSSCLGLEKMNLQHKDFIRTGKEVGRFGRVSEEKVRRSETDQ